MAIENNFVVKNGAYVEGQLYIDTKIGVAQSSPQTSLHLGGSSPTLRIDSNVDLSYMDIFVSNNEYIIDVDPADDVSNTHFIIKIDGSNFFDFSGGYGEVRANLNLVGLSSRTLQVSDINAIDFSVSGNTITTEFPNGPVVGHGKVITEKTSSFTFAITDANVYTPANSSSNITATVPPNSSVDFPVGTVLAIVHKGTGTVSWANGTGVTFEKESSLTLNSKGQYAITFALQTETDTWTIAGNLELA